VKLEVFEARFAHHSPVVDEPVRTGENDPALAVLVIAVGLWMGPDHRLHCLLDIGVETIGRLPRRLHRRGLTLLEQIEALDDVMHLRLYDQVDPGGVGRPAAGADRQEIIGIAMDRDTEIAARIVGAPFPRQIAPAAPADRHPPGHLRDLEARGAEVWVEECDVTNREQVEEFVLGAIEHYGSLDIVVANAGIIQVGPIETMRVVDFEEAMNVMFWGVFYTIWAALPYMHHRGSGKIVTITSIGGKISVPHLVPYSCAKFAAVALSEGLRTELAPLGIRVLTVVPGLMRTGSHLNAEFKGQQAREFAWFGLGASVPGLSMSIHRASAQIIQAMRTGRSHQILTASAQLAARFHGAFPKLSNSILECVNRYVLPTADGGSHERVTGFEAERRLDSAIHRTLTSLGRSAAEEMNEGVPAI